MNDYNESLHRTEITKYRIACAGRMTGRVLDVGGGLGSYLPYFNSDDVTVLDADKETLDKLQYKNKVLGDAARTPFGDESFDSIWACAVAEYLDCTLDEFVSEMKRICVRGGGKSSFLFQMENLRGT